MNVRINSGTNVFTSHKNLVNIGSVTSEYKRGVSGFFSATGPQLEDRRLFGTLAFRNGLEYRNFDYGRLIGNDFCTLCINFLRFSLVTPEFKT